MNALPRLLVVGALALAVCVPPVAAEDAPRAKKRPAATRDSKRVAPAVPRATRVESPEDLVARSVFQIILAEIALRRGEVELASNAYADLSLRSRDPRVLERTVEVTGYARRFDLAIEAAKLWVEVEPESKRAPQMLVSVMLLAGQLDGAAPYLVQMLESDKDGLADNLLGLNRMLARQTDRLAAFRLIEQVCLPYGAYAEAHYSMAVAAANASLTERARAEARRALEIRPDWEAAALLKAQLILRDSPDEAITFMERFLARQPQARDVELTLARALVGAKRYPEARRLFEDLLKAFPDNPDVVLPAAVLALQEEDPAQAEVRFRHLLALDVKDKGLAYYYLGQIAEDAGRPDEALAYYAAVGEGERYLSAQLRRAQVLARMGQLEAARGVLSSAKAANADERIRLVVVEAGLLREAKDVKAAFALLDAHLSTQPDQPDLLYESALLAERLEKYDLMETRLRRLMVLQPESAQAYNALGYSYAERNIRLEEARTLIDKALAIAPNDFYIIDSLGWVLYRQGDWPGALAQLERAYAARPDPEVAAHLGEVLVALGRPADARRILLEAQKNFPDSDVLAEAVRKFAP